MQKLPKLDPRLAAIASMVRPGARCADIGCDHGYLIAWLAVSGVIPAGCACDMNRKPLDKAAFTLSEYGVADRVRLSLSDGLAGIVPGEVDDIVIAGMGGDLIWEIVAAQPWTRDPALRFLLQPMTKGERLRRLLAENGFAIEREIAVVAGDFPYAVLCAAYTGQRRTLSAAEAWCGLLLHDPSEAAVCYRGKAARLLRQRAEGLRHAAQPEENPAEYEQLLNLLEGEGQQ